MPRLSSAYLEAVVFLYASRDAAEKQEDAGGTGFIVGVPWNLTAKKHFYFVSNKHVAKMGWPVVRLNTGSTGTDVVELSADNWTDHKRFDLAICPFDVKPEWSNLVCINHSTLLTKSLQFTAGIGCGDEVIVVGRFVGYDGVVKNTPFVHTGVISREPGVPKWNPATEQEEFGWTLELHSRGGYSGSPVFGYISPKQVQLGGPDRSSLGEIIYLLGVLWAYHQDDYLVHDWEELAEEWIENPNQRVFVQNGLAGVVNAEELDALLMSTDEINRRKKIEEEFIGENGWKR